MASHLLQLPLPQVVTLSSSTSRYSINCCFRNLSLSFNPLSLSNHGGRRTRCSRRRTLAPVYASNEEEASTSSSTATATQEKGAYDGDVEVSDSEALEYVSQIKRVLELLKKNRDMVFGEVKLTIMIEDPRDVERKRLLGIDDENAPTREDLAAALEEINEGKIPEDRLALQMLAEELTAWPNLETEAPKKQTPSKSLYARTTDTGVDLKVAAKRLKVDWDSAADIGEDDEGDDTEVPPAVGYGALYLVTAFPVIIGISVVLILFYNSLQ
nr:ycf3-interacting protein 1, chloroplastic [Ipomoea trifida]